MNSILKSAENVGCAATGSDEANGLDDFKGVLDKQSRESRITGANRLNKEI